MFAYNFNEETGKYIGSEKMQPDPLEPGRWLQPANSTLVVPPPFDPQRQTCRWTGTAWEIETIVEPEKPADPQPTAAELLQLQILQLKMQLAEDDYKIIKCAEYQAAGVDLPYNIAELHAGREAIRAEINQLQEQQAAENADE